MTITLATYDEWECEVVLCYTPNGVIQELYFYFLMAEYLACSKLFSCPPTYCNAVNDGC